jgi:hypothetical protein
MLKHRIPVKNPGKMPLCPKLKIRLNLGIHITRVHAEPIWGHVTEFKPDIFVMESATMLEEERKLACREYNKEISGARADSLKGAALLLMAAPYPFECGKMDIMLNSPELKMHYVEGYSKGELEGFESILREWENPLARIALLHKGDITGAMELEEKLSRRMGTECVGKRDKRIIRGFVGLGQEIREEYGLGGWGSITRILARFGTAHAYVAKALGKQGFDVEVIRDIPNPLLVYKVLERISENPNAIISREECAELLFGTLWQMSNPPWEKSEKHVLLDFKERFRMVGFAGGFLELLKEASRKETRDEWALFIAEKMGF